jgi:hypothetical protein
MGNPGLSLMVDESFETVEYFSSQDFFASPRD